MSVSFNGNSETTGAISYKTGFRGKPQSIPASAKCETTGSCGIVGKPVTNPLFAKYAKSETTGSPAVTGQTPNIEQLEKDVVSFRGKSDKKKDHSIFGTLLTLGALAAILVGGLGYAHKYGLVNKISNAKIKGWLQNSNKITKPCYDICKKVQDFVINNYDKIVKKIKK